MEFKEKKKSKKKLFTVFIILLSVGLLAYFDREKFCWALLIIGCIAYSEWGIKFVKKKLDKIDKEGYMLTEAVAVFICLVIPSLTVLKYKTPFKPRVLAALEGIYISF